MADKLTRLHRSWNMSRIKGSNTSTELAVRKQLFSEGYRYRINSSLEGKPDIIFPRQKVAVFIHGCFWHQHGCKDTYRPKTNKKFWNEKLDRNIKRDKTVKEILESDNWKVLYLWECEIEKSLNTSVTMVISELK